jgi:hypothetical protein
MLILFPLLDGAGKAIQVLRVANPTLIRFRSQWHKRITTV